jgi:hypothetical protein
MTDSPRGRIRDPRMPSLRNAAGDLAAVPTLPTRGRGTSPGRQHEAEQEAEKELEAG